MTYHELLDFISAFGQTDILPSSLQTIGLALLGILVPFAIAILTDFYSKSNNPGSEFSQLDLLVMLDRVFKVKNITFYTLLILVPILFWEISDNLFRILITLASIVGISLMIKTIIDVYRWTKGEKWPYRLDYLKNCEESEDLSNAWNSVWQASQIPVNKEAELLEIFLSRVENLVKKGKPQIAYGLILSFSRYIENRSPILLARDITVDKFLRLRIDIYKMKNRKKQRDSWYWEILEEQLINILKKLPEIILHKDKQLLYAYLKNFTETVTKHLKVVEESVVAATFSLIIHHYCSLFFSKSDFSEFTAISDFFPQEWKITKENLHGENAFLAKTTWNYFFRWAFDKLTAYSNQYDRSLHWATRCLFPEVDPMKWAAIVIFAFSQDDQKGKIRCAIERKWTFGGWKFINHDNSDLHEKSKKTYELATTLFADLFIEANLTKFIQEAEALKYDETSMEEDHRKRLIEIFQEMLNFIRNAS